MKYFLIPIRKKRFLGSKKYNIQKEFIRSILAHASILRILAYNFHFKCENLTEKKSVSKHGKILIRLTLFNTFSIRKFLTFVRLLNNVIYNFHDKYWGRVEINQGLSGNYKNCSWFAWILSRLNSSNPQLLSFSLPTCPRWFGSVFKYQF